MLSAVRSLFGAPSGRDLLLEPEDAEALRLGTTRVLVKIVVVLAPLWVVTYLVLGRPWSAAIPGAYTVISAAALVWQARRGHLPAFVLIQLVLFALLPVLLQWSLGGFQHASSVVLWSFSAPLLALAVYGVRAGSAWFAVFAMSIVVLGLAEGTLNAQAEPPPAVVRHAFFVLNIIGPGTAVMAGLIYFVRERDAANARTERLLRQMLPTTIAARLKRGEAQIADGHRDATVLFADIVDFTPFADATPPERLVTLLRSVFTELDTLAARHGLEKIKTLGDGYLAVAGVTNPRPDHALAATAMALEVQPALARALGEEWASLRLRVGLASGPLIAGVIGHDRLSFDVWGDTVNTASRMASEVPPGGVQVTAGTAAAIRERYALERRDAVEVKGKGAMTTYLVLGARSGESPPQYPAVPAAGSMEA